MAVIRQDSEDNTLNQLFARTVMLNWVQIAYIIIFILAVFTRFYELGERVMSHDESLHTVYSHNLYDRGFFEHSPLMHGPILFHFTALSYFLFGVDDFSSRIYAAVLGVIIVMFPILFRRWLGRTGAVLASLMLLVSPLMMYYSRYIRHDMPSILSAMLMFWSAMMYISGPEEQRRKGHWLYILAAAMLWNLGSKETAFIYIAIFGLFLTLYWLTRVLQRVYNIRGKHFFYTSMIGILLAGVAALIVIIVFSISLSNYATLDSRIDFLINQTGNVFSGEVVSVQFTSFLSWSLLTFMSMLAVIITPLVWAYRYEGMRFAITDALMAGVILLVITVFTMIFSSYTTMMPDGSILRTSTYAVALALGVSVSLMMTLIYLVYRIQGKRTFWRRAFTVVIIMFAVCAVLILIEELSHVSSRGDETAVLADPNQAAEVAIATTNFTTLPLVLVWVIGIVVVSGIVYTKRRGWWNYLDEFPEFDVLMVMGSLVLPWLTAVFIVATHASTADLISIGESVSWLQKLLPVTNLEQVGQVVVGMIAFIPMAAIAVVAGLTWNWRRWLIASAVFHLLFAFFFTTIFTNIEGLASGMIYSLQYWLEQQGERRGSQPQYYYTLVILPIYEFLPIIGSMLAMIAGMVLFWKKNKAHDEDEEALYLAPYSDDEGNGGADVKTLDMSRWQLTEVPFLLFVSFWAILNLVGYTLAGEKMPWLGTHMTVPMILLAGWYFGRIFDRIDLETFKEKRGWVYLLILPLLFVALAQIVYFYLSGQGPFTGTQQIQLEWTYRWLSAVLIALVAVFAVYRLTPSTGWTHLRQMIAVTTFVLLTILTARAAWMASFINYDLANEFLVYAHGAPGNKTIMEELEEMSVRTTGGMDIRVLYDNKFSWPGSWYMRDFNNSLFIGENSPTLQQLDNAAAVIVGDSNRPKVEPLLEDRFQRFDHMRLWWPIQDYFGLSAERVNKLLDLSSETSGRVRRGMFDIWWSRDYTAYGEAVGRSFALTSWPVSDSMSFYVRKDIAAQVWPYGVGDGSVLNPFTEVEVNECTANWDPRGAALLFDTSRHLLARPLGISVAHNGNIFVMEEGADRFSVFTPDGQFIESLGTKGVAAAEGLFFERPHSIAVAANGDIYIVDTWNYRIRRFDENYAPLNSWGSAVTSGFDAQPMPYDGFWGPRDIVIDGQGLIYISDTGNKRIRVYNANGDYIRDIGSGGSGEGQLNEPAGIAIHPDGRLFVADTWNRRVVVFNLDGLYLYDFKVRGWLDDMGNRPYIAIDPERNLAYVTDPDAGRVLVYTTEGDCVGSFGQFNQQAPNNAQFATVGGIAVDDNGNVYVTDYAAGRVLRFDPFNPPSPLIAVDEMGVESSEEVEIPVETTEEAESTDELEMTEEVEPANG